MLLRDGCVSITAWRRFNTTDAWIVKARRDRPEYGDARMLSGEHIDVREGLDIFTALAVIHHFLVTYGSNAHSRAA